MGRSAPVGAVGRRSVVVGVRGLVRRALLVRARGGRPAAVGAVASGSGGSSEPGSAFAFAGSLKRPSPSALTARTDVVTAPRADVADLASRGQDHAQRRGALLDALAGLELRDLRAQLAVGASSAAPRSTAEPIPALSLSSDT